MLSNSNWFMRITTNFENWVYKRIDVFWEHFQKANDNSPLNKWMQNTFSKFHTQYPKYQPLYQVVIWLSPIAISLCLENLWSNATIVESNMNNHLFSVSGLILMVVLYATMFSGYMLYHNRDKTKLSAVDKKIDNLATKDDMKRLINAIKSNSTNQQKFHTHYNKRK